MRKTLLMIVAVMMSLIAWAVPARRMAVTLQQPDGTKMEAVWGGDEFMSFYADAVTGNILMRDERSGFWRPMTHTERNVSFQKASELRRANGSVSKGLGGVSHSGDIHLPVLLVEFQDLRFTERFGSVAHFDSVLNSETYIDTVYTSSAGIPYTARSARNYYMTQSSGKFCPTFDIIGPVLLDHEYSYYGANSNGSTDRRWREAISEGIEKAISSGIITNATQWDCNGDKTVDLLYCIYAGYSEAQGAGSNYIWPKNGHLGWNGTTVDGLSFGQVSCSSELHGRPSDPQLMDDGIGTLVHEFGHALGLPDFYDTTYSDTCYGMDAWSVMDQGNYSGMGHIPSSMTLHERIFLGWAEPKELPADGIVVLEPISESNHGYVLTNPANPKEYLCLENHQHDGNWDQCWGGGSYATAPTRSGLLVTHVDFDEASWNSNTPNINPSHQHCTPLPADGTLDNYLTGWFSQSSTNPDAAADRIAWYESYKADIYPGTQNVTTLNDDNPYAVWFTGGRIDINITNIEELPDRTLRLTIGNGGGSEINGIGSDDRHKDVLQIRDGRIFIVRNGQCYSLDGTPLTLNH